jgi:hypothetical protein
MAGHGSPPAPDRANDPNRRVGRNLLTGGVDQGHIPAVEADDAWERPEYTGPPAQTRGWDAAEAAEKSGRKYYP